MPSRQSDKTKKKLQKYTNQEVITPSGTSSIFSEATNEAITAKLQQALQPGSGQAGCNLHPYDALHWHTSDTFARFLRRELYALSVNRNISSRNFLDRPRRSVTYFANSCATGMYCLSRPFIFGRRPHES